VDKGTAIVNSDQALFARVFVRYSENRSEGQFLMRRRELVHIVSFAVGGQAIVEALAVPRRYAFLAVY